MIALFSINYELILQESLYIGLLILLLSASFGLPLPEDIPLLLGGCLCRLGYGNPFYTILVGLVGVLTGDIIFYTVGRRYGLNVLELWPFRAFFTRTHIAQMRGLFRRYGNPIIFFGRFFAGVRSVMCVTAGISRVPSWKFILVDVSGAAITVPVLVGLGWIFSDKISKLIKGVIAFEHVTIGIIAAIIVFWIISIHISRKSRVKKLEEVVKHPEEEIENELEGKGN